jgi:Fe-S cluster assembly scaffold protein SufB
MAEAPKAIELHSAEAKQAIASMTDELQATGEWKLHEARRKLAFTLGSGTLHISPQQKDDYYICVEDNAAATITDQSRGDARVSIVLGQNATLHYNTQSNGGNTERFVLVGENAQLIWVDAMFGTLSSSSTAYLKTGASADFKSILLGKEDEQYTVRANMIHANDKSRSRMITKAALLDKSQGNYRGSIRILPGAARTSEKTRSF